MHENIYGLNLMTYEFAAKILDLSLDGVASLPYRTHMRIENYLLLFLFTINVFQVQKNHYGKNG